MAILLKATTRIVLWKLTVIVLVAVPRGAVRMTVYAEPSTFSGTWAREHIDGYFTIMVSDNAMRTGYIER